MKPSKDTTDSLQQSVGLATAHSLGGFFSIYVTAPGSSQHSPQLDADVLSAVACEKQSTANTGLGSKVKREQAINQKLAYCSYL